jgi:Protein kinase domain
MPTCPACARDVPAGQLACPACGAALQPPANATIDHAPSTPDVGPRFVPGMVLGGRYRIVAALGKGGMGEVWRADDLALGQPVALKFLPPHLADDPDRLQRFRKEVAVARKVSHPNCCRVYDLGESPRGAGAIPLAFLSMEYIDGENLDALLRRVGRLPEEKAVEVARQLCQALAAVHEQGLLHRDLKPANVMLDGRGRVRLTDFGLAAAAEDLSATELRSGTPQYMAPEQLAGKEVSVRSDLFALGLVLYELFTGKTAFAGVGRDTPPLKPSSHVTRLNPAVERIILRCLERDPAGRPASALAVVAALPGGDPLAAALAAGETPSPQLVADAPVEGSLRPAVALAVLAAALLGVAAVAALNDRTKLFRRVPLHHRPEVLAHTARELIQRLGHTDPPADTASGFGEDLGVLAYLQRRDASPTRWDPLASGQPAAMDFWYRQSPRRLLQRLSPANPLVHNMPGLVTPTEPPPDIPGMVTVRLDPKGRLIEFRAAPPPAPGGTALPPDWRPLFQGAGLDPAAFRETAPLRRPPVYADVRAAWAGVYPDRPEIAARVEAAALSGQVVFFRVDPADREDFGSAEGPRATDPTPAFAVVITVSVLAVFTGGAWLARRNWRLGRANRTGALRLAAFLLAAFLLSWLFRAHHSWSFAEEAYGLVAPMLGRAIFSTGFVGLIYLALEPYVRRRWPWRIVAWNRLLDGRFRDPLVGRDLLLGVLGAAGAVVLLQAGRLAPAWLGEAPARPLLVVNTDVFTNVPGLVFLWATHLVPAMGLFFMLFTFQVVLRREWLAAGAWALVVVVVAWGAEPLVLSVAFQTAQQVVLLVLLLRFGFLAFATAMICNAALSQAPLTAELSAWYAGTGILYALVLAGLAAYGFVTCLGGRPLLGKGFLGDE